MGIVADMGIQERPLISEEVKILDDIWPEVKPYLRPEGISTIEEKGKSVKDFENDWVTPLIGNEECAYTILRAIFICAGLKRHGMNQKYLSENHCHVIFFLPE